MYTPQSSLLSPGRIGRDRWVKALRDRGADAPPTIVNAYHDACFDLGINPDLALAQAWEETGCFTSDRWRRQRNPCGLGITSNDVPGHVFPTPLHGIVAHVEHLCCYAYSAKDCRADHDNPLDFRHTFHRGNPSLSELQDTKEPDWAKKPGYVGRLLAIANALLPAEEAPKMDALAKLTTRQSLLPETAPNWGKAIMRGGWPSYITVHETGNRNSTADAEMHRRFVHGGGGKYSVSFHAVVDDSESIQLMPWNWVAWHASDGNGDGNFDSIAIETCQNEGGDFPATIRNLVVLVAKLMKEFNIPLTNVVQHNHWAPDKKNCPEFMRANNQALWKGMLAAVAVAGREPVKPPPPARPVGWMHLGQPDTFLWPGAEGVIVKRSVVYYNSEKGKWYQAEWSAENGYSPFVEVQA